MLHSKLTPILILGYFIVLFLFTRFRPIEIRSRIVFLLRALLPSWKFFENIGNIPVLQIRSSPLTTSLETLPWQNGIATPKRNASQIFVNSQGNYSLACTTLLQRVLSDIESWDEKVEPAFETTVTYQLLKNLVEFELKPPDKTLSRLHYQFRVCVIDESSSKPKAMEEILISPVYHYEKNGAVDVQS